MIVHLTGIFGHSVDAMFLLANVVNPDEVTKTTTDNFQCVHVQINITRF